MKSLTAVLLLLFSTLAPAAPARLKDITSVEGVRDNPLVGYGLVVGLNGSGDRRQTLFSAQTLANLLQQMGVTVPPGQMQVRDTAAVMVTANLPPYGRPGNRIDVTAAAIGDATSLQGGLLLMTSLKGVDGHVYAVAQGPLVLGGFSVERFGSSQTSNHPTTGRVPNGATIELGAPEVQIKTQLRLQLRQPDFTTASRVAAAVNQRFTGTPPIARAADSGSVTVTIPQQFASLTADFIAELEKLPVECDTAAKVVVNERTGTVVMGSNVKILPVSIIHGNLSVEIQTTYQVSQPEPFSQGTTQIVPQTTITAREEKARNLSLPGGATVEDMIRSLAAIGATPRDVVAILQALQRAGALQAQLEVI